MNQRFEIAARSVPRSHVMALQQLAGIAYGQISSPLNLQQGAAETAGLRRALDRAGLPSAYVTGAPALQHDITPILTADLHRGELIAVLVALVLLVGVLGLSASVLVPFVVAACTTYGAIGGRLRSRPQVLDGALRARTSSSSSASGSPSTTRC